MTAMFALEPIEGRVLLSAGQLDPSFGSGGRVVDATSDAAAVDATAIAPDGKIFVAGHRASNGTTFIERYTKSGAPDTTFHAGTPITPAAGHIDELRVLSDGRIEFVSGAEVGRLLQNGSPDTTLNPHGPQPGYETITSPSPSTVDRVAIQPDGKFVYSAHTHPTGINFPDLYVGRINLDGTVDTSFGSGGTTITNRGADLNITDMAVGEDGTIAIVGGENSRGNSSPGFVYRYSSTGDFLTRWATPETIAHVTSVAPWSGNQFLIGIQFTVNYSVPYIVSADGTSASRVNLDGVTWGGTSIKLPPLSSDAAGRIYLGKSIGNDFAVTRFTAGHTDTTFGTNGTAQISFADGSAHIVEDLTFDRTGRLIVSGETSTNHVALAALHDSSTTGTGSGHRHHYHTGTSHRPHRYRTVKGPRYRKHH